MPIHIIEGADPLSEAAREAAEAGDDHAVINAQSEAGRLLRQELTRYCRGEINGRSFLVAGHRGAGKTTMVADAIERVLRESRRPVRQQSLMQPLPVFLHGPSLFEWDETGAASIAGAPGAVSAPGAPSKADHALAALTQIILGLHRAVVREFSRAYRERVAANFSNAPLRERTAFAELAAQFEAELMREPEPERLREFWALAGVLERGVLASIWFPETWVDRGARELVALSGMCEAYQRISGEMSIEKKARLADQHREESSSGISFKGAELVRPVVSVLSGVAVAGGMAGQVHSAGAALLAGVLTALGSSLLFTRTSTRTRSASRQMDTTFIPDLSLKTLDRILPMLLQRLRDAGLAPVLVIDELDKVEHLGQRLEGMIHYLKKLVAENVFTCFLTDRGYLEGLRLEHGGAYSRSFSYFSHPLLVSFSPRDFEGYLEKLLRLEAADVQPVPSSDGEAGGREGDKLDLEVLKWVLRYRSELHALSLARELSLLRGHGGVVAMAPGAVRTQASERIAVTFQVAIELQMAQPRAAGWLRLHPERGQTMIDALYCLSRIWARGDREFRRMDARNESLIIYLIERMNLEPAAKAGALVNIPGGSADTVLPPDDLKLLRGMLNGMIGFLTQKADKGAAIQRWADLPLTQWDRVAMPTQAVFDAMLLGDESLLIVDENDPPGYEWRYRPSGVLRDETPVARAQPAVAAGAVPPVPATAADTALEQGLADVVRINEIRSMFSSLALPHETVFEALAERLRILPTTPAWQPVRQAMTNLEHMRTDPARRGTVGEDARAVRGFVDMLDANVDAVSRCLITGAYLAGTAGEKSRGMTAELLWHCLQLLSAGLRFPRLDGPSVLLALKDLNERMEDQYGFVLRPQRDDFEEGYDTIVGDAAAAFETGARQLENLSRQDKIDQAWLAAKGRLHRSSEASRALDTSAAELVAGAIRSGPYRILGIDLESATLAQWTTTLMLAAEITEGRITPANQVPRWFIGHALTRLGIRQMQVAGIPPLMNWLLQKGNVEEASGATEEVYRNASESSASAQLRGMALCIAASGYSLMREWKQRPQAGMAWVVTPEQADLLFNRGLLAQLGGMAFVIARDGDGGAKPLNPAAPTPNHDHGHNLPTPDLPHVWIYRRREPAMLQPTLVNPASADAVLGYAVPLPSRLEPGGSAGGSASSSASPVSGGAAR